MRIEISPGIMGWAGRIEVPASKSISNRAMLLAAVSDGESRLSNVLVSEDTVVFAEAIRQLGCAVDFDQSAATCIVAGSGGRLHCDETVWVGSAGTAARFLLAVCSSVDGRTFRFDGSNQMRGRPLGPLLQCVVEQGATIEPPSAVTLPYTLHAHGIAGGPIECPGGAVSSQFLSAIMLAAPFARASSIIHVESVVSRPYIEMTAAMLRAFGAEVDVGPNTIVVAARPELSARYFDVETDASTASYFFAAAAILPAAVFVPKLTCQSIQGDVQFLDVLEAMGCRVIERDGGIEVSGPARLRGISVDMRDIVDTFPTLACVAPYADSPVTITGIAHTRHHESDRIETVAAGLRDVGVFVETDNNSMHIEGVPTRAATIESRDDHRIAMSFSVLGLRATGIAIDGAECVSKTCPTFFQLLQALQRKD